MRKFIAFLLKFAVILSVIGMAAYWLCYFLSATGKRFCFMFGNDLPDISDPQEDTPACNCNE